LLAIEQDIILSFSSGVLPCANTLLLSAKYKKTSGLYIHIGERRGISVDRLREQLIHHIATDHLVPAIMDDEPVA
jgi:hypothetical protein